MPESHQRRIIRQRASAARDERLAEIERQVNVGELTIRQATPDERERWAREREQAAEQARSVPAPASVEGEASDAA